MRALLLAVALLLAGCATPASDLAAQPSAPALPAGPSPRSGDGSVWVSNIGAKACAPGAPASPGAGAMAMSVFIPLEKAPGDTALRVRFEWSAVNPTADWLEFWLGEEGQAANPVRSWFAASPAILELNANDLAGLPDEFGIHLSATGCPPEGTPVHAVAPAARQDVAYAYAWNPQPA